MKLEGGTHNPLAPPFDFLAKSYLPLVAKLGANVEGELETYGFFPAGGGQCRFEITPGPLGRLELMKRGKIRAKRVRSIVSKIPEHVAERECKTIRRLSGWKDAEYRPEVVHNSPGPGNICLIKIETERITAVFSEPGERGVRAEQVAKRALAAAERWLDQDVPVCEPPGRSTPPPPGPRRPPPDRRRPFPHGPPFASCGNAFGVDSAVLGCERFGGEIGERERGGGSGGASE